jgi:hypothetical protein
MAAGSAGPSWLWSQPHAVRVPPAGASFKDARFPGADLQSVVGFEQADFEGACGSLTTRLPPDMRLPTCTKAQLAVRLSPDPE